MTLTLTKSTITHILAMAFKELESTKDHSSPEAAAKAMAAAEEENGEAIRRIMAEIPDLPVAAFPLVSMAYGLAALRHLGTCQAACWAECRTYATHLLTMMHLPAPDASPFFPRAVDFLHSHQDQLLGGPEAPALEERDPGDEDAGKPLDLDRHLDTSGD